MIGDLCKWKEINLIEGEARRQGDESLLSITNEAQSQTETSLLDFGSLSFGKVPKRLKGARVAESPSVRRSAEATARSKKHEVGANQACLNLLACRPTKCQLNEVKVKLRLFFQQTSVSMILCKHISLIRSFSNIQLCLTLHFVCANCGHETSSPV